MVFKGQDAWRKHPLLANCHANPFPHFRIAVGIFSAYVIADWAYHYPDQVEHYSESIVRYFTSTDYQVIFILSLSFPHINLPVTFCTLHQFFVQAHL